MYKWYTDERWRKLSMVLTQILGLFSAFALIMIGIFSEDYLTQHVFWTVVFFISNLAVLILVNLSLMTHPRFMRPIGYYGIAVLVVNLILVFISFAPLLEWLTVFTALGYVGLLTYNMFKL